MSRQQSSRDAQGPHGFVNIGLEDNNDNDNGGNIANNSNGVIVSGPRPRVASSIILNVSGSNYILWKTIMPSVLGGEPFAWDVIKGSLVPPSPDRADTAEGKLQMKNYNIGNRAGRYVLINSIHPTLVAMLILEDAEDVDAHEIWRRIKAKFTHKTGARKSLAMAKFNNFKYQPNSSVGENMYRYKEIVYELESVGTAVDDDLACDKLLESLPASWEPYRQGWSSREENSKNLETLTEGIEAEYVRRSRNDRNEVTAMFSHMNISRGPRFQPARGRGYSRRFNARRTTVQASEVVCYNCNQRGHFQAQCRAPRRNNHRRGNGNNNRGRNRNQPRNPAAQANIVEALIVEADQAEASSAPSTEEFILDSGSSHHMISDRRWMTNYKPYVNRREVRLGGGRSITARGSGIASVIVVQDGGEVTIELKDVLFVPQIRRNLVSLSKLADEGYNINIANKCMKIQLGSCEVYAERCDNLYMFRAMKPAEANVAGLKAKVSLKDAHRIFAHVNADTLKQMLVREGYEVINDFVECEDCIQGKMHRASYRPKPESAVAPGPGYIHADTCSVSTRSIGGANHFVTLTDDSTRFRKVYFVESKDQIPDCI
jgi:hypothetical protein